jgi:hypothetical protein
MTMVSVRLTTIAALLLAGQACIPDLSRTPTGDAGNPDSPPTSDSSTHDLAPGSEKVVDAGHDGPADLTLSDSDAGSGVGGPCPCKDNLPCISGICRAECTPSGACGVSASCPATHGCVVTSLGGHACVPAPAGPGQECGVKAWCPIDHLCVVSGSKQICLPVCATLNATCGTGGTCNATSGIGPNCYVCSST